MPGATQSTWNPPSLPTNLRAPQAGSTVSKRKLRRFAPSGSLDPIQVAGELYSITTSMEEVFVLCLRGIAVECTLQSGDVTKSRPASLLFLSVSSPTTSLFSLYTRDTFHFTPPIMPALR